MVSKYGPRTRPCWPCVASKYKAYRIARKPKGVEPAEPKKLGRANCNSTSPPTAKPSGSHFLGSLSHMPQSIPSLLVSSFQLAAERLGSAKALRASTLTRSDREQALAARQAVTALQRNVHGRVHSYAQQGSQIPPIANIRQSRRVTRICPWPQLPRIGLA